MASEDSHCNIVQTRFFASHRPHGKARFFTSKNQHKNATCCCDTPSAPACPAMSTCRPDRNEPAKSSAQFTTIWASGCRSVSAPSKRRAATGKAKTQSFQNQLARECTAANRSFGIIFHKSFNIPKKTRKKA